MYICNLIKLVQKVVICYSLLSYDVVSNIQLGIVNCISIDGHICGCTRYIMIHLLLINSHYITTFL